MDAIGNDAGDSGIGPDLSSLPSPVDDPDGALAAAVALRGLAERLESAAVAAAIDQGWSWAQIAQSLGVSKQAAHKKHSKKTAKKKGRTP